MDLYGHFGPLRGHNPIFFKTLFYSKIISLSIQMGSGRIIFYFNPLNGHYLYPPFFRNTKAKEEKMDLWPLTWAKSTRAQTGNIYQNLSKYISYQKIKVKNPPQGQGGGPMVGPRTICLCFCFKTHLKFVSIDIWLKSMIHFFKHFFL